MVDGQAPTNEDECEKPLNDARADNLALVLFVLGDACCDDGSDTWPDDVDEQHHKTHWGVKFWSCVFVVAHLINY